MGLWYRYDLMASQKFFAGMNPKYCYADNSATEPLKILDGVMNASLEHSKGGEFPKNLQKFKASVQRKIYQVICQLSQNGSSATPGRSLGSSS